MTERISEHAAQRRNKGFTDTHQAMIETAVRLISKNGAASRTTVYYHFESRDALLEAVTLWSSEQLAKGMSQAVPRQERMAFITRFVLENPELIKLWIDDFISAGDIRSRYPLWDLLVEGVRTNFASRTPNESVDAEVYCVMLLTSAIVGPRVFKNSVDPNCDIETVVKRFRLEEQRMLGRDALIK
jgi:AcrR family transcriptional regulator